MRSRRDVLAATAALSMLGAGRAAGAEPVKIRLSWVAPLANWGSIWLEKKELAVHLGQSYTLEAVHFSGTPTRVTAVANGELEVPALTFSALPIAVVNAGLDDLVVISDEFQDGVPGHYSSEYKVLADGPIRTVQDLKGKVLATNVAGSAVDVAMRAMLRKNGLEDNRDYTVIETPFPTMQAMLVEKKADLVTAVLPFARAPELQKMARTLFTGRDALGRTQFAFLTADVRSSISTVRRWSISWRTRCALHAGTWTPQTMRQRRRSRRGSPDSRPSGSTGCSPRRTTTAIRT
jgi:sulfonate transport system substrate-binding protein